MQSNFDIKHLDAAHVLFIARPCRGGRCSLYNDLIFLNIVQKDTFRESLITYKLLFFSVRRLKNVNVFFICINY